MKKEQTTDELQSFPFCPRKKNLVWFHKN